MRKILKIICTAIGFLFCLFIFAFAVDETFTITTYYPSPYGVYKTLRLYPTDDILPTVSCNNGEMYYDNSENKFYGCSNTVWVELGSGGGGGVFGGMYEIGDDSGRPSSPVIACPANRPYLPSGSFTTCHCETANPFTSDCSCPSGFTDSPLGITMERDSAWWDEFHYCWK